MSNQSKSKKGVKNFSWKAVREYKCPRCKAGDLFVEPTEWSNPGKMHQRCEKCNLDFEPEPGFYFGALIISYGISGWMLLLPSLALVFGFGWSVNAAMAFALALAAITYFLILRFSRSLYLHAMMRFDSSLENSDNSASRYDKTIF